uniref:NAD-dependent epimerase/dehydratase domain-containing protein n=1 Tax=Rhizophora mucronata TaxID=61149 RepID=A0A2P2M9A9_RHIMU
MDGDKGTVCVTGGTGFVASWLIMRLLEQGYSVNTTVRSDPENKRDLSFLTSLPGASKQLQIFHADLSDPESFRVAINGCSGVFHVATPVDLETKEPEEVVTKRTIDGALGILKACLDSKTVKRVVYTSAAAAVVFNNSGADVMDETFWSDVGYIKATKPYGASYMISKTSTEKRVIEFAAEHGLDLVTLTPPFIVGPFICPKLPGSVHSSLAMILGNDNLYATLVNVSMVHIDDVASAHIFLFENANTNGRYNCSAKTVTIEEMQTFLSAKYPEYPIPTLESLKDIRGFKLPSLSSKKLLDAGFKFKYGLDEMFEGAIQCCKEKGYL